MKEEQVYLKVKQWAIARGLHVLAGQPPSGTDHLPVLSIRTSDKRAKGNLESMIPDLVLANEKYFIIVECKPRHDCSDENKVLAVLDDESRKSLLYRELINRKLLTEDLFFPHYSTYQLFETKLRGALAHGGQVLPMTKLSTFHVNHVANSLEIIEPSDKSALIVL